MYLNIFQDAMGPWFWLLCQNNRPEQWRLLLPRRAPGTERESHLEGVWDMQNWGLTLLWHQCGCVSGL